MKTIILILLVLFSFSCQAQFFPLNRNYEGGIKLGYLYNYFAVDLSTGDTITSSDDWSIPTETQVQDMLIYAGGTGVFGLGDNKGLKFQEVGTAHWTIGSGTDDYGLKLVGSGLRSQTTGVFSNLKNKCDFFMSNASFSIVDFSDGGNEVQKVGISTKGVSVRLVKDATGISDGVTTTYTGNDGFVYPAIAIDELYWIIGNLVETQFRSGNYITGYDGGVYTPISDVNWAAKTTEAMCAYDDDLDNVFE